jgi:hypothetical protein
MDYQGMLSDLREMRNRMRIYSDTIYSSLWMDEAELYGEIIDFIRYIKELLASEEAYQKGLNESNIQISKES